MAWAWAEYRKQAWGQDEIRPVSGTSKSFLIPGQTVGLSIVEALDTLWLMGLDAEVEDGVRWIKQSLRFDLDGDAQVFEATIRLVGGLLSGHLATGEAKLLELAQDLARRMMPAFDTPTGMPMRYVNLRTGKTRDPLSFPAEIGGGLAPEFVTLSKLTGDKRFGEAAVNAMLTLYGKRSKIGLLADTIDVTTGAWTTRIATIGPPTDSYFEYLWDTWLLTGDTRLRDAYRTCTAAILAHLADRTTGDLWFANVDFETGERLDLVQSELSAFYPGLLREGGNPGEARAAMRGC
jgi:mannosyl-oligosaccharide alpha-1,2-mannosidase